MLLRILDAGHQGGLQTPGLAVSSGLLAGSWPQDYSPVIKGGWKIQFQWSFKWENG